MKSLTIKQKQFADDYIITGSAIQSAINVGYSKTYARNSAYKLLENLLIKEYVENRMQELEDKAIIKQDEILRLLTAIARREEIDYEVTKDGQVVKIPIRVSHQLKALELLGKRYGMWTDKVDINMSTDVIVGEWKDE
ncbi:terminase small subunit [Helcococcus bovis]|uniref:terminase small subunit n=1 Tax=Helcococcus bovis TaxID=3153252 RepID=UPI0038B70557